MKNELRNATAVDVVDLSVPGHLDNRVSVFSWAMGILRRFLGVRHDYAWSYPRGVEVAVIPDKLLREDM